MKKLRDVIDRVGTLGLKAHVSRGEERTVIGAVGEGTVAYQFHPLFNVMPGVDRVVPISRPYKLASREFSPHNTVFPLDGVKIGGPDIVIMAGPCSVEGRSQMLEIAHAVREAGAHVLRGGAFKPRTSPYAFQGMGREGLEILAEAREATGLLVVSEVMSADQVELVAAHTDILQIGARNMQNFSLLHAAGKASTRCCSSAA
jgi:3-deoxy-7-phosphoheptulonate synthase